MDEPLFIEYEIEEGVTVLIQAPAHTTPRGPVKSAVGSEQVIQADKTFSEALEGALSSARKLLTKVKEFQADEIELTFGLLASGELGNFAVGKVGVEANYEVSLRWKNSEKKST